MKDVLKTIVVFSLLIALIPCIALFMPKSDTAIQEKEIPQPTESTLPPIDDSMPFYVYITAEEQTCEMTLEEYVIGAVFGEMPAAFQDEALKAQAVAARTYAVRCMMNQLEEPDPKLDGAYLSDDSSTHQAYFSPARAEYFYGSDYEKHRKKIAALVEETAGEILVYGGEPIIAAFHSASQGMTESAENIWGNAVPYLVPVGTDGAEKAPMYESTAVFTSAEIKARLTQTMGAELADDILTLEITSASPSGTVLTVDAGGFLLTGNDLRQLLGLRSPRFTVSFDSASDEFTFNVTGSGHGAGMSQYGAEFMAENGAAHSEILTHYYKGAQLLKCTESDADRQ